MIEEVCNDLVMLFRRENSVQYPSVLIWRDFLRINNAFKILDQVFFREALPNGQKLFIRESELYLIYLGIDFLSIA